MFKKCLIYFGIVGLACINLMAFAGLTTDQTIGSIATNLLGMVKISAQAIAAIAYLTGIGFSIGAILKFKQHKENPAQIPIGTPVALLFMAVAMIYLPKLIESTSVTLFGDDKVSGGSSGTGINILENQR